MSVTQALTFFCLFLFRGSETLTRRFSGYLRLGPASSSKYVAYASSSDCKQFCPCQNTTEIILFIDVNLEVSYRLLILVIWRFIVRRVIIWGFFIWWFIWGLSCYFLTTSGHMSPLHFGIPMFMLNIKFCNSQLTFLENASLHGNLSLLCCTNLRLFRFQLSTGSSSCQIGLSRRHSAQLSIRCKPDNNTYRSEISTDTCKSLFDQWRIHYLAWLSVDITHKM